MSLFGLASVVFDKGSNSSTAANKGPLRALEGTEFDATTLRYPLDVGNYDKGHYMVFYIREQKNTSFKSGTASESNEELLDKQAGSITTQSVGGFGGMGQVTGKLGGVGSNIQGAVNKFGSDILSKVNSGLNQLNAATGNKIGGLTGALSQAAGGLSQAVNGVAGGIGNLFGSSSSIVSGNAGATTAIIDQSVKKISGGSLDFLRTTLLTKDAIALYMPDTLQYTYTQSYDQLSLGGELAGQALVAGKSGVDAYKEGGVLEGASATLKSGAGGLLKNVVDKLGGATGQASFTAVTGTVSNPMLEMIYKSPNFRTFQFDFTFYPRDEKEAYEVQRIIETFRFHQAPELATAQNFLIPPSEFDIRFYYGSGQNPNIPPIATCILTTIDVNYAPNGFSAYEVPGESAPALGRTGMPVAIQLNLQFQEVTYLTKKDFKSPKDFNTNASPYGY
jgi:hypothetical protein